MKNLMTRDLLVHSVFPEYFVDDGVFDANAVVVDDNLDGVFVTVKAKGNLAKPRRRKKSGRLIY